jgi:cyclase
MMQLHQALMIRRIDPQHVAEVARIFGQHDRETDLPRRIGVRHRELYEYHGIYLHLVQSDKDFIGRLYQARTDPQFRQIDEQLRHYLHPYDLAVPTFEDSHLKPFYTWSRD